MLKKIPKLFPPNYIISKYIKQKLTYMEGEMNKSTIRVGDFIILLSIIDRSSRQNISKALLDLTNTIRLGFSIPIKPTLALLEIISNFCHLLTTTLYISL